MRIVVTVPWTERLGGAEELLWTFLRSVDRPRIEPTIVFFAAGQFEGEVAGLGFPTVVVEAGRMRQLGKAAATVRGLAAVLRQERAELLLDWSAKTHLYGAPAAVLAGMGGRTTWWQHSIPGGGWLDRLAASMPARAVLCSSEAAATAQRRLWPRRHAVSVAPGTDAPVTRGDGASLDIPAGRLVVGIVGRLQPWKRQDLVIRAVAALAETGVDAHALVVGGDAYGLSPEYGPSLRALAGKLAPGRVTFTGQVADTAPYMSAMDVLVNASAEEPFGLVLIEAMALGTPVVAFDAGGPAEIVEHGVSGLLVRGDPERALVAALSSLAKDPSLRLRFGREGHGRWAGHYTAEAFAERLTSQLERLCRGRPR